MNYGHIIFLGLIIAIAYLIKYRRHFNRTTNYQTPKFENTLEQEPKIDQEPIDDKNKSIYSDKYEKRYLLTLNEKEQYRKLRTWAVTHNCVIFAKVRILDLIEPRRGIQNYKTYFWKIQAKHADFVICDENIKVRCIIELDDNSHLTQERKDRDEFLDEALTGAGYRVLRTQYITPEFLNQI